MKVGIASSNHGDRDWFLYSYDLQIVINNNTYFIN
jgi:hypothetical protein